MADRGLDVYLEDHLGGAMLGTELANQIADAQAGTPLGELMTRIAGEIEEDREKLTSLTQALDVSRSPVKEIGGWVAEKASRLKFSGATSGDGDLGLFMALESLRLGVLGKLSLWIALREVRADDEEVAALDLDRLIERATAQADALERERLALAPRALARG